MTGDVDHGAVERLYEISFDGDVHDQIRRLSPAVRVVSVPTHTVLWSRLRRSTDLDALLDSLMGMGITPDEVHEAADGGCHGLYCEVRIGGSLGEAVLRYLGWSHRIAQTTVVNLRATHDVLGKVLAQMTAITRVDYVLAR